MRTNLFKKIFIKHLHKGKEPISTFIDDVGQLKGIFTLRKFDSNGRLLLENNFQNMIVNQSKSSIIRLLGQGSSIHKGSIDPSDYVISKMRFSNDQGTGGGEEKITSLIGPNKLEYYSLTEPSNRISYDSNGFAGGSAGNILEPPANPSTEDFKHTFSKEVENVSGLSGYTSATGGGKIFDVKSGFKVPSNGSVRIEFWKDFGGTLGEQKIEEHFYNYGETDSPSEIIYTRAPFANKPWKIVNYEIDLGVEGKFFYHVSTPMNENVSVSYNITSDIKTTIINTTNSGDDNYTGTRIYFDYTTDSEGWKMYLEEMASDATTYNANIRIASGTNPHPTNNDVWSSVKINYTLGLYNVVNLIIPVTGTNEGVGTSILTRYNSNIDYYNVVTPTYEDCADDYIDDYAVTFTTSMSTQQGNGDATGDGEFIQYRKAYLFSKNDEMFSSIVFPSTEFQKDPSNSFQISWKILAPIN